MNAKLQGSSNSKLDYLWWAIIALLLAAGIGANFYFSTQPVAIRLIGWLVLACILVLLAGQTRFGQKAWGFLQGARTELRKVTWPTRQETVQTTIIVVVMVTVVSLILWGLDSILLWAVATLTGRG